MHICRVLEQAPIPAIVRAFAQRTKINTSASQVQKKSNRIGLTENDHSHKQRMNVRSFWNCMMEDNSSFDTRPAEAHEPHGLSRAERRDLQTQRVLDAAKACFVRHGFQGASMQEICAEAGMSPGALYRYFSSKEAIVEAISEADRRADAEIFAVVLSNPDVVDGVVAGAMAHIRHIHETNAAPLFAEICAESMRNEAVEMSCRKNMDQVQDMFRDYLGRAMARGEIDPPVELDVLLPALMAIAHGMALNDLPSHGVPLEKLEILVRASAVGMLRPKKTKA